MKKWVKVGLLWGLWMFVFMSFIWPFIGGEKITTQKILIGIPLWIIGGLAFGYTQRNNFKEKEKN